MKYFTVGCDTSVTASLIQLGKTTWGDLLRETPSKDEDIGHERALIPEGAGMPSSHSRTVLSTTPWKRAPGV